MYLNIGCEFCFFPGVRDLLHSLRIPTETSARPLSTLGCILPGPVGLYIHPQLAGLLAGLARYPCHTKGMCVTVLQRAAPLLLLFLLLCLARWASSSSNTATSTCLELQEDFCPPGASLGCCHSENGRAVQKSSLYPLLQGLTQDLLVPPQLFRSQ